MLTPDGKKWCSGCQQHKLASEHFYKSKSGSGCDGFAWKCKSCTKSGLNLWKENNRARFLERERRKKREKRPKEVHAERERLRRAKNPEQFREAERKRRAANPEQFSVYNKTNREKRLAKPGELERERLRVRLLQSSRRAAAGPPITDTLWFAVLDAFDRKCCYCDSPDDISIEHLTPIARGGTNEPSNLAPACLPCNQRKNKKTLEQFCPERAADIRRRALICLPIAA